MAVEPRLAQGHHFRAIGHGDDSVPVARDSFGALIRLDPNRRVDVVILLGQPHGSVAGVGRNADAKDRFHTRLASTGDYGLAVRVELGLVEVNVGVDEGDWGRMRDEG